MYRFFQVSRSGSCDFVHRLGRPKKDAALTEIIAEQRARSFAVAENFFSILKTECIYRHKPAAFRKVNGMNNRYIDFYNHKRIQLKTGVAPLTLHHSA